LLLRSFEDDERADWRKSEGSFVDTSLESRLTGHFAHFGPFIAVGAPSDGIPVIGASRMKLNDAEWQGRVSRWIDESIAIVLIPGLTHWVAWELRQVIQHGAVDRLIVCFPPARGRKWREMWFGRFAANRQARLERLQQAFAGTCWSKTLAGLDGAATL